MVATMNTAVLRALHQSLQKVLFCTASLPRRYKTYSDPDQTFEFPDYTYLIYSKGFINCYVTFVEEKKEKHAEIQSGLDEADVLKDFKQVSSPDANQSTREELMEPGMVDVHAVSVDQSGGFVMSKEKIDQSSDGRQKTNPHAHTKLQSVDDAIDNITLRQFL
ncbi:hypothetical protein HID58_029131 [Brassica napus]|uniref:Uncharacterized protein n=1 Tax=Brassica napus TaxID=3708 RepID=A0ABQ8CCB0_BRANA|nr:hypothetical protein HID58_029131 [Brassica napus]